jgi:hypothetical protein
MSSSSNNNNSNATTTRDLQDTYVTQLAHLFALKDEQYNLDNTRVGMSHEIERLKTEIEWNLAKEESMGSSTRKNSSQTRMKRAIEVAEKKLVATQAALQEHDPVAESHRLTVNAEEAALQTLLDTFFPCPVRFQEAGIEQQQQAPPGVSAFWRMMEDVDAAAHMLEYMSSVKDALCGVGAVSRAYKAQTEAVFSTIILRYQTNSTIPPLTKFPRLRHLRIDAVAGAHCLAGLGDVAAQLESLAIEIKTRPAANAFGAIASFPKLRHLHFGKSNLDVLLYSGWYAVGKLPLLESLAVHEMDWGFYNTVLGSMRWPNSKAFPNLRSLAFPANHVLFGSGQQYLRFSRWESKFSEAFARYPETRALEIGGSTGWNTIHSASPPGLK